MRGARIVAWFLGLVLLLVALAITFTTGWRPIIGARARALTDRRFEPNPQRLARGKYLTESVLNCFACHSNRDWAQHDVPLTGGKGGGATIFPIDDVPGRVHPPNISPDKETDAGNWTDDQLARAIREGIGNDGRALFPMMPYENYRYMSDEDLASVVVYLRTIPPVRQEVPKTEIIFPVKYLMRTVPEPVTTVAAPDLSTPVKRGDYLVTLGGCRDCHTPSREGQRLQEFDLAGGWPIKGPWGNVASANLTTDPSGIPYYDEVLFREVMRTGHAKARKIVQIMPWWYYRGMTDEDLNAMFAYLRSVPAIRHRVDNAKPPTLCARCGFEHGAGDQN